MMYAITFTWLPLSKPNPSITPLFGSMLTATDPRRSVDAFQKMRRELVPGEIVDIINIIEIGA